MYEDNPEVKVIRRGSESAPDRPNLQIKYNSAPIERLGADEIVHSYGVLNFHELREYRWVSFDLAYTHFNDELDGDVGFTLVEILESKWVEAMSAGSWYLQALKSHPETFRPITLRHFRITFDDYGVFDIVALDFTVEEITETVRG